MNKRLVLPFVQCLFYIVAAFMQCALIVSIAWAGFDGFGNAPLVYTEKGLFLSSALLLILPLLLLGFLATKIISLYRHNAPRKIYLREVLLCLCGVGIGVLIFFMIPSNIKTWLTGVLIDVIRNSGWLRHQIP